nr:MAG TPA: hypothetical protein [Caudoviricetes sp.]
MKNEKKRYLLLTKRINSFIMIFRIKEVIKC